MQETYVNSIAVDIPSDILKVENFLNRRIDEITVLHQIER